MNQSRETFFGMPGMLAGLPFGLCRGMFCVRFCVGFLDSDIFLVGVIWTGGGALVMLIFCLF